MTKIQQAVVNDETASPIVVGGVGGSGTRVIAEILIECGIHMGFCLNKASDNLLFTLIFKRNDWLKDKLQNGKSISSYLALHERLLNNQPLTLSQKVLLANIIAGWLWRQETTSGLGRYWAYLFTRNRLLKQRKQHPQNQGLWGWKEPNSHLVIERIFEYYPNARYIHTMRHGLDMAYSDNQQQLENFGELFNISVPTHSPLSPADSLAFWLTVNEKVLSLREKYGSQRVHIVNYDDLCQSPVEHIEALLAFAGIDVTPERLNVAATLPQAPSSTGRYQNHSLENFAPQDLARVRALGFSVE